jgi:hypothetical protein
MSGAEPQKELELQETHPSPSVAPAPPVLSADTANKVPQAAVVVKTHSAGLGDDAEDDAVPEPCIRPHILNEFSALGQKHIKQRCRISKGGCCGKCAIVCTLIEMLVPIGLSLMLWIIYDLVDELVVGPVQMDFYRVGAKPEFFGRGGFTPDTSLPLVSVPLALKVARQKLAIVKGESATWNDIAAFKARLDKGMPGFNLATATLGACANEQWHGNDGWQYAMKRDVPSYLDLLADGTELSVPKLSDVVIQYESEAKLNEYVKSKDYEHDLYAAIVLDQMGSTANGQQWKYTIRTHTFRGLGMYDAPNDDPLSPAAKTSRLRRYFLESPWITGAGLQRNSGDRGNARKARRERDFMRVPMPSIAALQMAVDRAIIDTEQGLSMTVGNDTLSISSKELAKLAAQADVETSLELMGGVLLQSVTHGEFASVFGMPGWNSDRRYRSRPTSAPTMSPHSTGTCNISALTVIQKQSLASAYIDLVWAGRARIPHAAEVFTMPGVEYLNPEFYDSLAFTLPIFYILIYLLPVFNQIRATVAEKETRLAEGMLIMGMNEACRQAMWMVTYGTQHIIVAFFVTVGLCNPTGAFGRSDFTLVLLMFTLYGLAVTAFGNFIALFFERAKTAAVIGTFIFLIGLGPFMFVNIYGPSNVPEWGQVLATLAAPSALGAGVAQISTVRTRVLFHFSSVYLPYSSPSSASLSLTDHLPLLCPSLLSLSTKRREME